MFEKLLEFRQVPIIIKIDNYLKMNYPLHRYIYLLIILSQLPANINAQKVSGYITDNKNNNIEGAFLYNTAQIHTHTDHNGYFSIDNLADQDTLIITYLGYETIKLPVFLRETTNPVHIKMLEAPFMMDQIQVVAQTKASSEVSKIDILTRPVASSQEILARVPGLFIAQHAGGGKAEQIFLRGFDLDHGTDISIQVDGMPVNMVSHAHGQGYADLHFIIPETIENIDFGKGPYNANQGNFATAGFANFKIKDDIKKSSIGLDIGEFNSKRLITLIDLSSNNNEKYNAYIGSEYLLSDGPFEFSQNFNRWNIMGKIVVNPNDANKYSLTVSNFISSWDASGQIPQRLVDNGTISRYGSVDPTEGGSTSRMNVQFNHRRFLSNHSFIKTNAYFSQYDFELFSNFTFFLNDPENSDQIKQREHRNILGVNTGYFNSLQLFDNEFELEWNIGMRSDNVNDSELSHTKNRVETLERIALGDINETNIFTFFSSTYTIGRTIINPIIRADYFDFGYHNKLSPSYESKNFNKYLVSPKINIYHNIASNLQLYAKAGYGFHSNDTRTIAGISSNEINDFVPKVFGSDLGIVWKPINKIWINTALWYLHSNQEFTYVGDEGVVEPNGASQRTGIDFSLRYQITKRFFLDTDINKSNPKSLENEKTSRIPLAPRLTSSGGLTYLGAKGLSVNMRYKFIDDRPANESGSIIAQGYKLIDLNTSYEWKSYILGISINNLFNSEWNEAQFATTSRLQYEENATEELHFTPGAPRNIKMMLRYIF